MRITYVGSYDEVEVPSVGVVCKRGATVEVPDSLADSLLEQSDNWQPVKATEKKKEA
jgi:hypothetical protein